MKYLSYSLYGLLPLIVIWLSFYIGYLLGITRIAMNWYDIPYTFTCIIIFFLSFYPVGKKFFS
jgi:hypothetical protein